MDLSLVWLKKDFSTNECNTTETNMNAHNVFRDGCKTIMSILVIVTNDCGNFIIKYINSMKNFSSLENTCDHLTSDERFFSNLFRLLVTIEQSSFSNEEKFDTLALVCN